MHYYYNIIYDKGEIKMKKKQNMKLATLIISIICIALLITPVCNAGLGAKEIIKKNNRINIFQENDKPITAGTEYWALIFAVGIYKNNPDADRPSMLEAADNLYDALLSAPEWQPDHIHVVKGAQATGKTLVQQLRWLIQNVDEDDRVLVYLTTHGSPLRDLNGYPRDLPPKDEADGADEILIMYDGFDKWYAFIWDDLLNFLLSLIKGEGLCLIVDSCFSGGFNDPPFGSVGLSDYSANDFTEGLAEELATQGRIVLMSSEESTVSYGSYFSEFLIYGFEGYADLFGNGDGINSAEEAFYFAKPWVELLTYGEQHPTIFDLYDGEFPVTS
jgi:hypothetical protein